MFEYISGHSMILMPEKRLSCQSVNKSYYAHSNRDVVIVATWLFLLLTSSFFMFRFHMPYQMTGVIKTTVTECAFIRSFSAMYQ